MRFLVRILGTMFAIWVAVQLVPGLDFEGSIWALAGTALVIAIVNAFVKPIMAFLSLPLIVVTLGLFILVVNALAFLLAVWLAGRLGFGLTVTGFWPAFWGALVVTVVSWLLNALLDRD